MAERKDYQYSSCSAIVGTLTNAQKAQKALAAAAIPARVGKLEASSSHRGCVWSINFSCNQMRNVKSVLASSGINVRAWEGGDDIF